MAKTTLSKSETQNLVIVTIDEMIVGDSFAASAIACKASDGTAVAATTARQQFRKLPTAGNALGEFIDERVPVLVFPGGAPDTVNVPIDIPASISRKFAGIRKVVSDIELTLPAAFNIAGEPQVRTVVRLIINTIEDNTKPPTV